MSESREDKQSYNRLQIVDMSEIAENEATDRAQKVVHREIPPERKKFWGKIKDLPGKMWHELTKNYKRNKELRDIRGQMSEEGNLYAGRGEDKQDEIDNEAAIKATLTRFNAGLTDEEVLGNGEEVHEIVGHEDEGNEELKMDILDLIENYGRSGMIDSDFLLQKNIIFDRYFHGKKKPKVSLYADNALELAKAARDGKLHVHGLRDTDSDFRIVIGRAKTKYKTEANYTHVDKAINFLQRSPITDKIPPSVLSAGVAVAFGLSRVAKSMATKTAKALTFGFGGAAITGVTRGLVENKRLKEERAEVARSTARGEISSEKAERRKEMKQFIMEMKSAQEIIERFRNNYCDSKGDLKKDLSKEEKEEALKELAETEARIEFSNLNKTDTISYGGNESETLYTDFMIFRAQMKVQMRKALKYNQEQFKRKMTNASHDFITDLDIEKKEKDVLEKKFRRNRALKAALTGAMVGFGLGIIAQEATACLNEDVDGVIETHVLGKSGHHGSDTTLKAITKWFGHKTEVSMEVEPPTVSLLNTDHSEIINLPQGGTLTMDLPPGFHLHADTTTGLQILTSPDGKTIPLSIDPKTGMLDTNSIQELRKAGFQDIGAKVDTTSTIEKHYTNETLTPEEYMKEHSHDPGWYMRDKRPVWLGNNTPMWQDEQGKWHGADFNELRAYHHGENGTGFMKDGSAQFRIDMKEFKTDTEGDQLNGSQHRNIIGRPARAIKEGRMFWELTPVKDGPTYKIPFHANPDGTVTAELDPNNPVHKMFIDKDAKGHMRSAVYMSEIVEEPKTPEGRAYIYASGRGHGNMHDIVVEKETVHETINPNNHLGLTKVVETAGKTIKIGAEEIPVVPVLPVYTGSRRELEQAVRLAETYGTGYGSSGYEDRRKLYDARRSPTLEADPKAKLDHYKEIGMYLEGLPPEYKKQLEKLVEQIEEPMGAEVKIVSCIPVAGHQEGGNIYESLENYTHQTLDPKEFEIVLFVNHPTVDNKGKTVEPDETMDEIKRFQEKYPQYNVRVMYQALPPEQAKIGLIRKMLNDAVLMRQHARGKDAPDLIMVSNDADNKGVAPKYFEGFLEKFEEDPELEGALGHLDWDPEAYARHPEVFIGTRLFMYMNARGRVKSGGLSSSGANFAFKSSIFAGIGGYLPELSGAEDIALGEAIRSARGGKKTVLGYSGKSLLHTSARRSIDMWEKYGAAPIRQWDKGFGAFDELRKKLLDRGVDVDYGEPEVQKNLKDNLESVINQTIDEYERGEKLGKDSHLYRKILNALGIPHYQVDEHNQIRITDMTTLAKWLNEQRDYAVLRRDMRSGKPGNAEKLKKKKERRKKREERKQSETKNRYTREYEEFMAEDGAPLPTDIAVPAVDVAKLERSTLKTDLGSDYVEVGDEEAELKAGDATEGRSIRLGYNKKTKKPVVIKRINSANLDYYKEMTPGFGDREKLLVESGVSHPNLQLPAKQFESGGKTVRIYDLESIDLKKYLESHNKLDPKQAVAIMLRICDAVRVLHENKFVHTDISPNNILLSPDSVKLIDMDEGQTEIGAIREGKLVKDSASKNKFRRKGVRGNRFLLPPELMDSVSFSGSEQIKFNKGVDIYEMGATLYRTITGKWPHVVPAAEGGAPTDPKKADSYRSKQFKAYAKAKISDPIEFPPEIPAPLKKVLKKALSPFASSRYQSAEELGLALIGAYKQM